VYQYSKSVENRATTDLTASEACLGAIARVTGHRVEDLTADMCLEDDLGVDPMKMVDLFGAIMQELPYERSELIGPGGFFGNLVSVHTVDDLLRAVERLGRDRAEVLGNAGGGLPSERGPPQASPPGSPLRRTIVEAIARVSGHCADDLSDELSLEADVGLDSLKRVQLLNELSSHLPASTTEALSGDGGIERMLSSQTIGDLVQALTEIGAAAPGALAAQEPPVALAVPEPLVALTLADAQMPFLVA
jgi:acyl carrier protein